MLKAWVEGDWAVARGAYFASVLDESVVATDPWDDLTCKGAFEGMTRWQVEGVGTGYGLSEYLDTLVDGAPVGVGEEDGA